LKYKPQDKQGDCMLIASKIKNWHRYHKQTEETIARQFETKGADFQVVTLALHDFPTLSN